MTRNGIERALTLLVLMPAAMALNGCIIENGREEPPPQAPPPQYEERVVVVDEVYDDPILIDNGTWVDRGSPDAYWVPRRCEHDPNWRPYTDGGWVQTSEGMCWNSNEPDGARTCHYGRWYQLTDNRWAWRPGREYAPAWVSWRSSDRYSGWAPLAPRGYVVREPERQYVFVEHQHITQTNVKYNITQVTNNVTIYNNTTEIRTVNNSNKPDLSAVATTIKSRGAPPLRTVETRGARTGAEAAHLRQQGIYPVLEPSKTTTVSKPVSRSVGKGLYDNNGNNGTVGKPSGTTESNKINGTHWTPDQTTGSGKPNSTNGTTTDTNGSTKNNSANTSHGTNNTHGTTATGGANTSTGNNASNKGHGTTGTNTSSDPKTNAGTHGPIGTGAANSSNAHHAGAVTGGTHEASVQKDPKPRDPTPKAPVPNSKPDSNPKSTDKKPDDKQPK